MSAPPPEHGTRQRYRHGCHCRPCTDAVALEEKTRLHLKAIGAWQDPSTDAEPARTRLLAWRSAGYGWREMAAAVGLSDDEVWQIAVGRPSRRAPARIRRDISHRILSARMPVSARPAGALVDAAGTRRRLRALAVTGWHLRLLAKLTGLSRTELGEIRRGDKRSVRGATVWAVRREFERIGAAPPAAFGHAPSKDVTATVNRAVGACWVPADRWGEDIDDPAAVPLPKPGPAPKGSRALAVAEDAEFLRAARCATDEQVAERLGVSKNTLQIYLVRAQSLARADSRELAEEAA